MTLLSFFAGFATATILSHLAHVRDRRRRMRRWRPVMRIDSYYPN